MHIYNAIDRRRWWWWYVIYCAAERRRKINKEKTNAYLHRCKLIYFIECFSFERWIFRFSYAPHVPFRLAFLFPSDFLFLPDVDYDARANARRNQRESEMNSLIIIIIIINIFQEHTYDKTGVFLSFFSILFWLSLSFAAIRVTPISVGCDTRTFVCAVRVFR